LAEPAGEESPDGIPHWWGRATWDADEGRDELPQYVVDSRGAPEGVLLVEETGFLPKGDQSVGVQRQSSGTAGGVENCQIGVFLACQAPGGRTFLDRALYLPRSWTEEPECCPAAGVPETVKFATKRTLTRQRMERALDQGVSARWVTGEAV
jgi:SRSO17 transposase